AHPSKLSQTLRSTASAALRNLRPDVPLANPFKMMLTAGAFVWCVFPVHSTVLACYFDLTMRLRATQATVPLLADAMETRARTHQYPRRRGPRSPRRFPRRHSRRCCNPQLDTAGSQPPRPEIHDPG